MSEKTLFADIILPLYVPKTYTYRIPTGWENQCLIGQRVVVQFGKTKLYTGIIQAIHSDPPKHYTAKYLENILDREPIVTTNQLKLWEWMANYYMCYPGEIFQVALPGNLKLSSETKFFIHPESAIDQSELNDHEFSLIEMLGLTPGLTIQEIGERLKLKAPQPFLKKLVDRKFITSEEEIQSRYKPKTETLILLHPDYQSEKKLQDTLTALEKRAPKQVDVLMAWLRCGMSEKNEYHPVNKQEILALLPESDAALNALIKKDILVAEKMKIDRHTNYDGPTEGLSTLNEGQQRAFERIQHELEKHEICLLHGVTASGKTEIYFKFIENIIQQGKQVLFLLPEIAITTQMVQRLQKAFGDVVGVYHSRFSPNERVDCWMKTLRGNNNGYKIILGARSAVFLPFQELGLVIVDEEHEQSYKQQSPSPRYNGRDVAIVLAKQFKCKLLLGSATPSVESYSNAINDKYGYVQIRQRYADAGFPEIITVDLKTERKKKTLREDFSDFLLQEIEQTIHRGEQVIIFQNRRGYTSFWICDACGWIPQCTNCNVSLTYHKNTHQLICHYCNSHYAPHSRCNACGSNKLRMVGMGTEKIEETIQLMIPDAKPARMDLDTTRSKNSYRKIIDDFEEGKINVLVGTQMVTKGLDFSRVGLVAIPFADSILHFPEFRAYERAYQLFTQVAGRAGRKKHKGKVIIQTNDEQHMVLQLVKQHDFESFYTYELNERKKYFYPPYSRIIQLEISHKDEQVAHEAAAELGKALKSKLKKRILGPERPLVNRVRNLYLEQIIIKLEKSDKFNENKQFIAHTIDNFRMFSDYKSVRVIIDVDPY